MGLASIWEEKGIVRGKEELVVRLLRRQLGSLDEDATARLERLTAGQLDELGEALLDFKNISDLEQWLAQHSA